ncbi:MAG: acyl-CoA dehydrogenase family protein [Chloroflexota bacterium]
MDYRFTAEQEKFRTEIRVFLKQELSADEEQGEEIASDEAWAFAKAFQKKLAAKGWLVPHWPNRTGLAG